LPAITKPTRITISSATLIEQIYTNNVSIMANSGIIITDVADHFATFHMSDINNKNKTNPINKNIIVRK
jgi:hypothetical protein